jgi:hypothetical protein
MVPGSAVRVTRVFDLAEVTALDGTGRLFLRAAVSVLDLDELRTEGRNLAVDAGVCLDLIAAALKASVAVGYVGEGRCVVSAAAWHMATRSRSGFEGGGSFGRLAARAR